MLLELITAGGMRCWLQSGLPKGRGADDYLRVPLVSTFLLMEFIEPENLDFLERPGEMQSLWIRRLWPKGETVMDEESRNYVSFFLASRRIVKEEADLLHAIADELQPVEENEKKSQVRFLEIWLQFLWDFYFSNLFIGDPAYDATNQRLDQDPVSQTLRAYAEYKVSLWHYERISGGGQIADKTPILPINHLTMLDAALSWLSVCPRRSRRSLLGHPLSPLFRLSEKYDEGLRDALRLMARVFRELRGTRAARDTRIMARLEHARYIVGAIHEWANSVGMTRSARESTKTLRVLAQYETG